MVMWSFILGFAAVLVFLVALVLRVHWRIGEQARRLSGKHYKASVRKFQRRLRSGSSGTTAFVRGSGLFRDDDDVFESGSDEGSDFVVVDAHDPTSDAKVALQFGQSSSQVSPALAQGSVQGDSVSDVDALEQLQLQSYSVPSRRGRLVPVTDFRSFSS